VPRQIAQLPKRHPAPLLAAEKRHQHAVPHPLIHLLTANALGAYLRVDIQVHVQRGVPPLAERLHEQRRVAEARALSGLEVLEERGEGAREGSAGPARNRSSCVFGHVLRRLVSVLVGYRLDWPYDAEVDFVRSVELADFACKALLQVAGQSALACAQLAAVRAGDWEIAVLLVAEELGLRREDESAAIAPEVILFVMGLQSLVVWTVEVTAWL
jgi:hypothetical protein